MLKEAFILIFFVIGIIISDKHVACSSFDREYHNEWAAKVSDPLEADLIAMETGFINRGPVISAFLLFLIFEFFIE